MFTNLDSSLYSVQSKGNYKKKKKTKATTRVEIRKTKTELFEHKNRKQKISLCIVIFATIAKICYDSENSLS